jgi:hypothetical protein
VIKFMYFVMLIMNLLGGIATFAFTVYSFYIKDPHAPMLIVYCGLFISCIICLVVAKPIFYQQERPND